MERFFQDDSGRRDALQYMQALTNPKNKDLRSGVSNLWGEGFKKKGPDAIEYAVGLAGKDDPLLRELLMKMFEGQYGEGSPLQTGSQYSSDATKRLAQEAGIGY
jgi:hypothetical protein